MTKDEEIEYLKSLLRETMQAHGAEMSLMSKFVSKKNLRGELFEFLAEERADILPNV